MDSSRIRRSLIALTAAYAVALNALFLSFVPLSAAALTDTLSALCATNDTDGARLPVHHQAPCVAVCAAMGHGVAGAAPLAVAEFLAPRPYVATVAPPIRWVSPKLIATGPQSPRGPPAV